MRKHLGTWGRYTFFGVWALSTAGLGWQVLQGQHAFGSQATLPALLALLICTIALLWWLNSLVPDLTAHTAHTRRGRFVLVVALSAGVLFFLQPLIGRAVLFALPVLGLVVLVLWRPRLSRQEVLYALFLALVAGVAGLGAGWVTFSPLDWAGLQVALVLPGLLAGWSILRHRGLLQAGVGRSLLVMEGWLPALRGFAQGILIGMPWALGMIVLGAANKETVVQRWWQPLAAIQPGIAEEAGGGVMLVPFVFLVFRAVAGSRTALTW